jgi:hypothetical protein
MPAYTRFSSKTQMNEMREAEAIAKVVQRPTMKFVPTKDRGPVRPTAMFALLHLARRIS